MIFHSYVSLPEGNPLKTEKTVFPGCFVDGFLVICPGPDDVRHRPCFVSFHYPYFRTAVPRATKILVGQSQLGRMTSPFFAIFGNFLPFFAVKSWILCSNHGGWSWILQDLYHFISRVWHHFRKLAVLGGYTSCFWARPYIIYQFVGYIYISYIYICIHPIEPMSIPLKINSFVAPVFGFEWFIQAIQAFYPLAAT